MRKLWENEIASGLSAMQMNVSDQDMLQRVLSVQENPLANLTYSYSQ